jgi:hypothetical protein
MANYVFSTMSESVAYTFFDEEAVNHAHHIKKRQIVIQGGANKADKFLRTPQGVATKVTDEQLELLLAHPVFLMHQKNGFISVEKNKVLKPDITKEIKNLEKKDKSAPIDEKFLKDKLKIDKKLAYTDKSNLEDYVNDNLGHVSN